LADLGYTASYGIAYILARFFGLFFIVIGLMVLVRRNQKAYFDQFVESKEYLFVTGLMTLILGAIIVALFNTWTLDWRLLITILGWLTLLKGAMMLIMPEYSVSIWKRLSVRPWILLISGVLYLLLGFYLAWIGFG
jgi:hypothetical protein